jgi:hypothetical protein
MLSPDNFFDALKEGYSANFSTRAPWGARGVAPSSMEHGMPTDTDTPAYKGDSFSADERIGPLALPVLPTIESMGAAPLDSSYAAPKRKPPVKKAVARKAVSPKAAAKAAPKALPARRAAAKKAVAKKAAAKPVATKSAGKVVPPYIVNTAGKKPAAKKTTVTGRAAGKKSSTPPVARAAPKTSNKQTAKKAAPAKAAKSASKKAVARTAKRSTASSKPSATTARKSAARKVAGRGK